MRHRPHYPPRPRDHHESLRRMIAYLVALLQRLRSKRLKAKLWSPHPPGIQREPF